MSSTKDILEKHLESFNDVFADVINVLIYGGKKIINENDLEDINPKSYYVEDEQIREQERDISKKWTKNNIILSLLGIENQTNIDPKMPFRVIGYEGVSYKYMLANKIPPCPVVTIVLNFSMKRWIKHRTLFEELDIEEGLKPFVNDYKINVIDVAFLPRETVNKFKSDFKIIADYFVQLRETGEYKPMSDDVRHIWELLNLMSVLTDDDRFLVQYYKEHRKERANMCEVLDKLINDGKAIGLNEGKAIGVAEGKAIGVAEGEKKHTILMVERMLEKNKYPIDEIADLLQISVSEVNEIANRRKSVQSV